MANVPSLPGIHRIFCKQLKQKLAGIPRLLGSFSEYNVKVPSTMSLMDVEYSWIL